MTIVSIIIASVLSLYTTQSPNIELKGEQSLPQTNAAKLTNIGSIPLPEGYELIDHQVNTFPSYLRNLPLKQDNNDVYLYNGSLKGNQDAHYAVVKMDVGDRDLQQCADAVMRLRAEYLYSNKEYDKIKFKLASGKTSSYVTYTSDRTYSKFRKYLNYVFSYANTRSLKSQLIPVGSINDIQSGDVFIQSGNPYGHAVIVLDVAKHKTSGRKLFLLGQSYMPAQEIEVLINPTNAKLSPWYSTDFTDQLLTPEWIFTKNDLRRF